MTHQTEVLVIGSGIAGLFFALKVAPHRRVTIVTKKTTVESNTNYAQGGIASVFSNEDSFDMHVSDTLTAGAGLCHRDVVEMMVHEGPALINELISSGVDFTQGSIGLDLGREGGHSKNRIVHFKDVTGREVERVLVKSVQQHPNITVLENHIAIDLITEHNLADQSRWHSDGGIRCSGAYVLDKNNNVVHKFIASTTVLSTGGCGHVYAHTTNPDIATGDGVAMAYRAGARIGNMEFIQFHPTTLYHPDARSFLISEAVRGFGAYLRTSGGDRFMSKYDQRLELAPRDIVARAIDSELKRTGDECVYLDLTHLDGDAVRDHFPNILEKCASVHIDPVHEPIPVVPAAHYSCGGVMTDVNGRSSIANLFVCGETGMTGVHGANRLASNSLLEALVIAERSAREISSIHAEVQDDSAYKDWDDSGTLNVEEWVLIAHNRREVQTTMWDYVGIVRSDLRLERALRRMTLLAHEIEDFYKRTPVSEPLIELRNVTTVANLIIRSALLRKESRGLHFMTDYPLPDPELQQKDTILSLDSFNHWNSE
jgi:L-aspartate oxidase